MKKKDEEILFVLRRTVWKGKTTRQDVMNEIKVSEATASKILNEAARLWPDALSRDARCVKRIGRSVPAEASPQVMLGLFANMSGNKATGITKKEFGATKVASIKSQAMSPSIMQTIMEAIIDGTAIDILYVSFNKKETEQWRSLFPIVLEMHGDEWILVAQDIDEEKEKWPVHTYEIGQIKQADKSTKKIPKKMTYNHGKDADIEYKAFFNKEITPGQKEVVCNKLGITTLNGNVATITMKTRQLPTFKRLYMSECVSQPHILAPIFEGIEVVKK